MLPELEMISTAYCTFAIFKILKYSYHHTDTEVLRIDGKEATLWSCKFPGTVVTNAILMWEASSTDGCVRSDNPPTFGTCNAVCISFLK